MEHSNSTNTQERITEIEIAIIGAGPAGIAAGVALSKLGHAKEMILFDREDRIAMTSRHCNHQGFGLLEFRRPMSGDDYADALQRQAEKHSVSVKLKHTLTRIEEDLLTFSTPDGEIRYRAKRILFAMGAREMTRPDRLVSGGRSPNIITTGALQRFTYIQERKPFNRAVIIGSELVSFSAIMTARHAGIEIAGIIEEDPKLHSFGILKPLSSSLLKVPVYTDTKLLRIHTEEKEVTGVTILKQGIEETIACDGVIFSGGFIPESALLHKHLADFDTRNYSVPITQYFQTQEKRYFLAGNVIRGALTAFNCYFEGREAGRQIHASLQSDHSPVTVAIEADPAIEWLYPSLLDISKEPKHLTRIRFARHTQGLLRVLLNDKEVMQQQIHANPYLKITVDWFNRPVKAGDRIEIRYEES